jgi:hypothetical protein
MNVHEFLNTYLGGNKNVSTLTYDALAEMLTDYAKALQLQQTGVIYQLCECGGNERVALDCTLKNCRHPKYNKK